MKNKIKCSQCRRELDVGIDVIKVEEGVMGMKGFIPIEKILFFCCEECIREYFDLSNLPSLPGRLP
jgi:hypothetical protein